MATSSDTDAPEGWTYRSGDTDHAVEYGTVAGRDVALPAHFHEEDQLTFVVSGRRRFVFRGPDGRPAVVETVDAGHGLLIPARAVHRSLPEPGGVACLNLYVPAATYAVEAMLEAAQTLWNETGRIDPGDLARIVGAFRSDWAHSPAPRRDLRLSIAERARQTGVSRESFTRAFTRREGMPPHAFDLMGRLNDARRLLRRGERVAAAAYQAGFADQSHLGRCFRQAFGITPGQFRRGLITNVPDVAARDR